MRGRHLTLAGAMEESRRTALKGKSGKLALGGRQPRKGDREQPVGSPEAPPGKSPPPLQRMWPPRGPVKTWLAPLLMRRPLSTGRGGQRVSFRVGVPRPSVLWSHVTGVVVGRCRLRSSASQRASGRPQKVSCLSVGLAALWVSSGNGAPVSLWPSR